MSYIRCRVSTETDRPFLLHLLGLVLVATLLVGCGEEPQPAVDIQPERLAMRDVFTEKSRTSVLMIRNAGDASLEIQGLSVGDPFSVSLKEREVEPGGFVVARVTFAAPATTGDFTDSLVVETNDSSDPRIEVPVTASVVEVEEVPLRETTSLRVKKETAVVRGDSVEFHYTVELPPVGPTRAEGEIDLDITGDLPPEAEVRFSRDSLPLGRRELAHLSLRLPRNLSPGSLKFRVSGTVRADGSSFSISSTSHQVLIDSALQESPPTCDCPEGTSPPNLHPLAQENTTYPDPQPPGPGRNPVANVEVEVEGPTVDECCIDGDFLLTLRVDSRVGGANDAETARWLTAGMCPGVGPGALDLTGSTKGTDHPVEFGSNNATPCGGPNTDRTEVRTRYNVDTECPPVLARMIGPEGRMGERGWVWPCVIPETEYVTRFEMTMGAGPPRGAIEVHWALSFSGRKCTIAQSDASITNILFFGPGGLVYDPTNDGFLPPTGDADGDTSTNYEEVLEETDPQDANSTP